MGSLVFVFHFGIGKSGAKNAALQVVRTMAKGDLRLLKQLESYAEEQIVDVTRRQQQELDAFVATLTKGDAA